MRTCGFKRRMWRCAVHHEKGAARVSRRKLPGGPEAGASLCVTGGCAPAPRKLCHRQVPLVRKLLQHCCRILLRFHRAELHSDL